MERARGARAIFGRKHLGMKPTQRTEVEKDRILTATV